MKHLAVTLIDVGWGDSILIESEPKEGPTSYALVDCNDSRYQRSSFIFIKRLLERKRVAVDPAKAPTFDFVLLTHGHSDHSKGLKRMIQNFGTAWFYYPKSPPAGGVPRLLSFANRSPRVKLHQAVDQSVVLPDLGDAQLEIMWPPHNQINLQNENLNSVVLSLTLDEVTFVLTGDAEARLWREINLSGKNIEVFQVPHHGAKNGTFDHSATPWLDTLEALKSDVRLAVSSHTRPHKHPHPEVVGEFLQRKLRSYQTDQHFHVTFKTHGSSGDVEVTYAHSDRELETTRDAWWSILALMRTILRPEFDYSERVQVAFEELVSMLDWENEEFDKEIVKLLVSILKRDR